jgi:hypothetical protein
MMPLEYDATIILILILTKNPKENIMNKKIKRKIFYIQENVLQRKEKKHVLSTLLIAY